MRKHMTRMRGGRWSAESGSVYRVLRRLEKDGLVTETGRVGVPNRERTEYELTPTGEALLNSWMTFPPDRHELGFLVDPIRTRSYFLGRLRHSERIRVVRGWVQENRDFLITLERDLKVSGFKDPIRNLGYYNLLYLAQGRQEWLKKMLAYLKQMKSDDELVPGTDEPLSAK